MVQNPFRLNFVVCGLAPDRSFQFPFAGQVARQIVSPLRGGLRAGEQHNK